MANEGDTGDALLINPNSAAFATIILAHGAMAPMDSPFLNRMAELLVVRGLNVVRFEFSYMAARRNGGPKRPPPRAEKLLHEYTAAVAELRGRAEFVMPLIIGGKSLGGRVASMVADGLFAAKAVDGLVCLGYPFHPPNKPENLRILHLKAMMCPTLILQGERDPFGCKTEIEAYQLEPKIEFLWMGDGDHDFGPRGRSGYTKTDNMRAAADAVQAFAQSLLQNT